MSSDPRRIPAILIAALILFLAACSTPPRGRGPTTDPDPDSSATERSSTDDRYEFEDEGEIPEAPGDVAFEEDELPPRPEDMEATPLDSDPVAPEEVGERGDPVDLPDPAIDAGSTPSEPQVTTPVAPAVTTPIPAGSGTEIVRGFRVQLFAVAEHARAQTMAQDARQRLGIEVHVVSEPPYFKVRAGDFVDRGDAVRMKERATSLGFDGCWVVTDQIELPK
jgi:cell division septation protein DedD